jgi:hypothetical protein
MKIIATIDTARKKTERNDGSASARNPNAAPGFRIEVILNNPGITLRDSYRANDELMKIFVS